MSHLHSLNACKEDDKRFLTFFRNPTGSARPAARFVRLEKVARGAEEVSFGVVQMEVFDYLGNRLRPQGVVISPQTDVSLKAALVDGDLSASKARVATTQRGKRVFMQIDLGTDVEVAGVRVHNLAGQSGIDLLEANLKVCTRSGVAVFNCPIRDNRLVYNIRTSPLEMKARRAYGYFNEEFFVVPGACEYAMPEITV